MDATGILEVQVSLMDTIVNLWQLWLGGTFAFVIAFHSGKDSLTKAVLIVGCLIYVAASLSIAIRYYGYVIVIYELNQDLLNMGAQPLRFPDLGGTLNLITTAFTFVLGTTAATWFAISQFVKQKNNAGDN